MVLSLPVFTVPKAPSFRKQISWPDIRLALIHILKIKVTNRNTDVTENDVPDFRCASLYVV